MKLARLLIFLPSTLLAVSCAGIPTVPPPAPGAEWSGSPLVATRFGLALGQEDADRTWVWKAIPYARPPVGDLRWRAPQDPLPWSGVRRQAGFNGGCTRLSDAIPGWIVGSEDCLYLNVWRPRDTETGLPVYVWIHGGGNSTGSSTGIPEYYGTRVADRSRVVFVSLNYRLGPFGWFTHPALRTGAGAEDASGNFGTLDLVQALKWIQRNIESFGGDPSRVTITGESAGGIDVLSLLLSPLAHGLFRAAMSQSGAALTRSIGEADAASEAVLEQLLVKDGSARSRADAARAVSAMTPAGIGTYLRSRGDRQILSLYHGFGMGMVDIPTVLRDGTVIPLNGYEALTTGDYPNKVPVILGSNADELKIFLRFATGISWQSDLYQAISRYGSRRWKVSGVDEVARRLTAHPDQPPVYAYFFRWGTIDAEGTSQLPNRWGEELGATHGLDVPFFLGHDTVVGFLQAFLFSPQSSPGRRALSAAMMRYVAGFVRTGNPNPPDGSLPEWAPWSRAPGGPKFIVFDTKGDEPVLRMSSEEITDEQVMASAGAELPEPLRSRTLDWLESSPLPSGVR
jgi:para-nitrobenzyl esterase